MYWEIGPLIRVKFSYVGGPYSNLIGSLITQGDLNTGDMSGVHTQRKDLLKTQQEGGHWQAKDRNLRGN